MEMRELTMRLRSSLRCSKKVIAPPGSSGGVVICVLDSDSGTDSGRLLVVMGSFLGICDRRGLGLPIGRFFRRAWDRFGNWCDHWVFGGARFCPSLVRNGLSASGPAPGRWWDSLCGSRRSGSGFSGLLALGLHGLPLHLSHFFFEGALEVRGGLAKLGHKLSQAAGE